MRFKPRESSTCKLFILIGLLYNMSSYLFSSPFIRCNDVTNIGLHDKP